MQAGFLERRGVHVRVLLDGGYYGVRGRVLRRRETLGRRRHARIETAGSGSQRNTVSLAGAIGSSEAAIVAEVSPEGEP